MSGRLVSSSLACRELINYFTNFSLNRNNLAIVTVIPSVPMVSSVSSAREMNLFLDVPTYQQPTGV
jgi:hypothetical protein